MKIKFADFKNGFIHLTSDYNHRMVSSLRRIKGARWDARDKCWILPFSEFSIQILRAWGVEFSDKLKQHVSEISDAFEEYVVDIDKFRPLKSTKLPKAEILKRLLNYQLDGVKFIDRRKGSALIADDMGLGKTLQALAWIDIRRDITLPAIVVCPASLKLNWQAEIEKWTGMSSMVLSGYYCGRELDKADVYIVNYDILNSKDDKPRKDLYDIKAQTLIIDECHLVSNYTSLRTKNVLTLSKSVKNIIALTGTPVVNRPIDIYYPLRMVEPKLFLSRTKFAERYCGRVHNGFAFIDKGATNTEELSKILKETVMLRRVKSEVLKELPSKRRIIVPMEVKKIDDVEINFNNIEHIKRQILEEKWKQCIDWIKTYLSSDKKLVVFCIHRRPIEELMQEFKDMAVKVDGSVTGEQRHEAVRRFQTDDKIRLFVGQLKAAGVGLTLTAASATCFLELGWSPSDHSQAEDRVHRIGQEADSVEAYYLVAKGTLEQDIMKLLDEKQRQINAVIEGKNLEDQSIYGMLFDLLKRRKEKV